MHHNIIISRASVQDAELLSCLSVTTFRDTFGAQNRKEDMDKYLAQVMSLENLSAELADEANYFFIARHNTLPAGYAKVRANSEPDIIAVHPLELERIYVLNQYQGIKAGAVLMKHCIDFAKSHGHDVLWLGVWELNHKAISFYKKWGFGFCGSHPFLLGDDMQTDVLMRKDIE